MRRQHRKNHGFTLIELSIVLVIIGLIIGGILVGQDMIKQATVRAQITQLQKYNTAVNTFRGKYGYLPGDVPPAQATQFGFYTDSNCDTGPIFARNGNGLIADAGPFAGGESILVWLDLSMARLIDQSFTLAPWTAAGASPCYAFLSVVNQMYPDAKLVGNSIDFSPDGASNWFLVMSSIYLVSSQLPVVAISVADAYQIDTKIDDGKPTTGNVVARLYNSLSSSWSTDDTLYSAATDNGTSAFGAPACFNTTNYAYAMTYQGGTSLGCLLSVKPQ